MNSIVHRYIFVELWPPFTINVVFFSFVFLMTQVLEITNIIVNYQVDVKTVLLFLAYGMPFFLQFIIPMSVMISVLLTFLRMSADMEIVALKAGGVSIYRLLWPVMVFGLIGCLLTGFMAIYGLPHGRSASKVLLNTVAAEHLDLGLKPRKFIDTFKDVVLYIHEIDATAKTIKDVFIEDRRSGNMIITVVAPRGQLNLIPAKYMASLKLYDGSIHQVDLGGKSVSTLKFDSYDIRLDMSRSLRSANDGPKDEEEMNLAELRHYLKSEQNKDGQYNLTLMEWHKKFSLPAANLALALLAIPLGIRARWSKRTYGIGLGLFFFLLYYVMLSLGWVFGEAGVYPPLIGMWVPNGVTAAMGTVLLIRAANEKPIILPPFKIWVVKLSAWTKSLIFFVKRTKPEARNTKRSKTFE